MIKNLIIAPDIRDKLDDKHHVKEGEVHECFMNHDGPYLEDTQEDHRTEPPTEWFIATTDRGRLLKVIFVCRDGNIYLKSAFDANIKTQHIYSQLSKKQE
ncbi:MAG: ADP-ribosyl-(dinitrogen reductase) hydrolase [Betaproteobacteria bacterium HGW-Betaproteobacteria-18]|nr:MAG: ADP-ribosyl-(dinitrogen reductase) hydrolase [Betaproteobacteria bacterium HGW-Betaproteobacteria-18]